MPGPMLTTASTIQCPHGGTATLATTNQQTLAGASVLLETDTHFVVGCPFTIGTYYSPCVTITWSAGASQVDVHGAKVLVTSSVGTCKSAAGAPQGVALIGKTQAKVSAR